ncbi:MAG: ThuA domain-containing protein [Candidatus Methanofastidiosia archaeon]|jgi:hypothetical protein
MRTVLICVLGVILFCGSLQSYTIDVMVDVSHSIEHVNAENNLVVIGKLLPEFTFDYNHDQALTEDVLKKYDVVMMYEPHSELDASEIEAVKTWVWEGGGLIVCGVHDIAWNEPSRNSFNRLVSTFGIQFLSNAVDDPTDKKGCYCTPVIHNLVEHPLTAEVSQIVFYKPCALTVTGDAEPIARGDDDTKTVGIDNLEGENIIVVAVSQYEKGKVIVMGSNSVFVDSFINQPNNQEFSINCFQWASEQAIPKRNPWTTVSAIAVIVILLTAFIALKKRKRHAEIE